jgi:predicted amidohydrolase
MQTVLPLAILVLGVSLTLTVTAQAPADKNPGHLKMAMVSMKCEVSDLVAPGAGAAAIQQNLDRHIYFIDRLAAEGVEFIGFPECSINGYRYSANMLWLKQDGPEIGVLQKKAIEKGVYLGVGFAEQDAEGKKWEIQVVIGPDGKIVGWHRKNWLTKEKGYIEASADHNVFEVKGTKMGILICADGTDFRNLKATVDGGAKILYGPHANTTGGTIAKWYNFRAKWGGPWNETPAVVDRDGEKVEMPAGGWIAGLKVYAALCNHAGLYNPEFNPPAGPDTNAGWASGAWFISPDGATLAQMPPSGDKNDSKEFILVHNIPLAAP